MFEILVVIFIFSLYAAFIIMGGLWVFRIIYALRLNIEPMKRLAIIFYPGGLGLYKYAKDDNKTLKRYRIAVLIMFVFAIIGGFYIAFLNIHWVSHSFFYGF